MKGNGLRVRSSPLKKILGVLIVFILTFSMLACSAQADPFAREQTPGDYSGSARWAYDLSNARVR